MACRSLDRRTVSIFRRHKDKEPEEYTIEVFPSAISSESWEEGEVQYVTGKQGWQWILLSNKRWIGAMGEAETKEEALATARDRLREITEI